MFCVHIQPKSTAPWGSALLVNQLTVKKNGQHGEWLEYPYIWMLWCGKERTLVWFTYECSHWCACEFSLCFLPSDNFWTVATPNMSCFQLTIVHYTSESLPVILEHLNRTTQSAVKTTLSLPKKYITPMVHQLAGPRCPRCPRWRPLNHPALA